MASGTDHDKSTRFWAAPFAIVMGLFLNVQSGLIGGAAFLVGGLWLSPDLDTNSIAKKRWGILQHLWWPYRKLIPHRSFLSHGPFLGTAVRIIYILILSNLLIFLLKPLGFLTTFTTTHFIKELIQQQPQKVLAGLIGLEASAWLHLIKDGDPMPTKWHN